ncbi:hypothetical protein E5082_09695 [Streptomyces griseoluteus]|uniref:Uncharacterized protein n=1 Tax=Streptomyces griseoluteus TaxID=29306 RepID=A0A4Z1DKG7_STRGP|nr:hypothetical protein [Streptomyces griseoluteus]TGN84649.1 hypothetical protein E5082_09695 [Streptomyces griseoluteus]GHF00271.1 hypothetical protein GCM10017776_16670 [Streptomyces griseoluteus]
MPQHNPHTVPDEPGVFVPVEVEGWQHGYDAGISSPPNVPRTPLVRNPDYGDAWAEGAVSGNRDGRTEGWRWAYFHGDARPDPQGAGGPYEPRDSGEDAPGYGQEYGGTFAQSWACLGELPLSVVLAQFAPGGRGGDGLTGRLLARACADKGVTALYLPVSLLSSGAAEEGTGDPLNDAGYWHGTVQESLDEAAPEAIAYVTVRQIRYAALLRYQHAAEHNFFDLLPVDSLLPPNRLEGL